MYVLMTVANFAADLQHFKSIGKICNTSAAYPQHKLTCWEFKICSAGQFSCSFYADFFRNM